MTQIEEVHLRLISRLTVRTVASRHKPPEPGVVYGSRQPGCFRANPEEQERLVRRVHRLAAAGVDRDIIADALNLSTWAVDNYLSPRNAAKFGVRRR